MLVFDPEQLHRVLDLTKPLRKPFTRRNPTASPRHTGYYFRRDQTPSKGFNGYQKGDEISDGCFMRLRIKKANEFLRGHRVRAYWTDNDGFESITPMVALLPKSRGFLAGYSAGEGMFASFEVHIYADPQDAAWAAHSVAENAAEKEREYGEAVQARDKYDSIGERLGFLRVKIRDLIEIYRKKPSEARIHNISITLKERSRLLKEREDLKETWGDHAGWEN